MSKGDLDNLAKANDDNDLFVFVCTSNYQAVTATLDLGASEADAILDSGASRHFSPHWFKFLNFEAINRQIKTADGHTFRAVGKGDVPLTLPNGKLTMSVLLKDCMYAPEMAFTLISVSRFAKVTGGVTFTATHAIVIHT